MDLTVEGRIHVQNASLADAEWNPETETLYMTISDRRLWIADESSPAIMLELDRAAATRLAKALKDMP